MHGLGIYWAYLDWAEVVTDLRDLAEQDPKEVEASGGNFRQITSST
jgi:hypothetical protein